jgi:hypothetical protein
MKLRRIVASAATDNVAAAQKFCCDVLRLDLPIDHDWLDNFPAEPSAATLAAVESRPDWGGMICSHQRFRPKSRNPF